ncbi:PPC domain-containing protein [Synechococcus sp. H55.7]|uniref:PPC domain-containing protein n=1 Tax=unclassified Synechococcus TaxID=2626047 RepID=UPI0039C2DB77
MLSLCRSFALPRRWGSCLALSLVALGLSSSCRWLDLLQERSAQVGSSLASSPLWRDGRTLAGTLSPEDLSNPQDGSFWDEISITSQPGQILIAALESEDFDAYLELVDGQGRVIGFDDDSGPDINALLAVRLPEGGTYTLRATSFEPESTGNYRLTYVLTQIDWQQTPSGRLQEGSLQHPEDGSWMDEYPIAARAGQILIASLTSADFDAFLQLLDPSGEVVAWDDDQGGGTDALMIAFLPRTGTYTLRANTYGPGEKGAYELQYTLR